MITITRTFEWDMGHRVTNHASLCKNPHGHRYKMEMNISGPMNDTMGDPGQGMVLDFGHLKTLVNKEVVDKLDHSFMYWKKDEVMRKFATENNTLRFVAVDFVPTAECIVQYLAEEISKVFKKQLPEVELERLEVYETPTCKAIWSKNNG